MASSLASQTLIFRHPTLLPPFTATRINTPKPSTISFPPPPFRFNKLSISLTGSTRKLPTLASAIPFQSVGPLFLACIKNQPIGVLESPLKKLAEGVGKLLDIYGGVLMVRVLLTWFPNTPWERQPFSAIRDLCDPFLSLFRNIVPPVLGTLDISPVFAFIALNIIGSILGANKVSY